MFFSICSAVARFVTSATTRRWPPQGKRHTSQAKVRCKSVAQSMRRRFCLFSFGQRGRAREVRTETF